MIFWKYHGLGNDFILFEDRDRKAPASPDAVMALCDRRTGIGGDGILYVRPDKEADAYMKIMNSDGSEAEMCGNGIRCVAKHLYDFSFSPRRRMRINTLAGMKEVDVAASANEATEVSVGMGAPRLDCRDIPMGCEGRFVDRDIEIDGLSIRGTAVSMGNPHFIIFQPFSDDEVRELGPKVHSHHLFPRKTNVEFVQPRNGYLDVTVFERGAGWTQACGTGACATAVAAGLKGIAPLGSDVKVRLPGGDLTINVMKDLSMVRMTGPATRVFQGEIDI
ncbi:MAG: diaminopimelate epimerase [Methanomassiliicoccus sp.]|nr:diaminopimelate epimerase [Methanomassiliicoccus sp.]